MTSLFVLTSPLQVYHALQYRKEFGLKADDCVLLRIGSVATRDNNEANAIAAQVEWYHRAEVPPLSTGANIDPEASPRRREYDRRQEFLTNLAEALAGIGDLDQIVLGDYRPVTFRQVLRFGTDRTSMILLDDGSVTREVMRYRENPGGKDVLLSEIIRARPLASYDGEASLVDPFEYPDPKKLSYFTIYTGALPQDDQILINRHYEKVFKAQEPEIRDETWIIGANHVEAGITSHAEYDRLIGQIASFCGKGHLVYVPHRRENTEKIESLAQRYSLSLRPFNGPIELQIEHERIVPRSILAIGSTVVDTLSKMLNGYTDIKVIVPDESYFCGKRPDHLRRILARNIFDNIGVDGIFAKFAHISAEHELEDFPLLPGQLSSTISKAVTLDGLTRVHDLTVAETPLGKQFIEKRRSKKRTLRFGEFRGSFRFCFDLVPHGCENFTIKAEGVHRWSTAVIAKVSAWKEKLAQSSKLGRSIAAEVSANNAGVTRVRGIVSVSRLRRTALSLTSTRRIPRYKGNVPELSARSFELRSPSPSNSHVNIDMVPGRVYQIQLVLRDPAFAEFAYRVGNTEGIIVLGTLQKRDLERLSSSDFGGRRLIAVSIPPRKLGEMDEWSETVPVQIRLAGGVVYVRSQMQRWVRLNPSDVETSSIQLSASDALGGESLLGNFSSASESHADEMWFTTPTQARW